MSVVVTGFGFEVPPPEPPLHPLIADSIPTATIISVTRARKRRAKPPTGRTSITESRAMPAISLLGTAADKGLVWTVTFIGVVVVAGVILAGAGAVQVSPAEAPEQEKVMVE